jgi:hypothetical protein
MDAGDDDALITDAAVVGDGPFCVANRALRCDGSNLVRCNAEGTAEVQETCALGCSSTTVRCNDVNPSNGIATQLDMAAAEPDLDLGATATVNTDDGTVLVDGNPVAVTSAVIFQDRGPAIRVFLVRSLTARDVTSIGSNALAVVSTGDVKIGGVFSTSAFAALGMPSRPGPGRFNDGTCQGGNPAAGSVAFAGAGAGGGGFGGAGGPGGFATNANGTATGGAAGTTTGNSTLVPLRGGCDSGVLQNDLVGFGGGAIQLVSRTRVTVNGVVAANGSGGSGGGSGGGILLEAPIVDGSGNIVTNGGAGAGGCLSPVPAENGRLDTKPATGGTGCTNVASGSGGNGGAGNTTATGGASVSISRSDLAFGGHGGGGVGRIRVNTVSGGLHTTGLFSPNPSTGAIGIR